MDEVMLREELINELCENYGGIEADYEDWSIDDLQEELDMCKFLDEDEDDDEED